MKLFRKLHRVLFPRQLTILAYHSVVRMPPPFPVWSVLEESSFRRQMVYLKEHFRVVSLAEGVEQIRRGGPQGPLVAITFDDGYQNNFEIAFPILRQQSLPATVFLTTGLVGTQRVLWDCQLRQALALTRKSRLEWSGKRFALSRPVDRVRAFREIAAGMKTRPHPELITQLGEVLDRLGQPAGLAAEESSLCRMLSHGDVREMVESGLIEFGAHTHSHAILSRLSGAQKREEIKRSIVAVKEMTGRPCRLFAYPNGKPDDYDRECIDLLAEYGVQAAVTTTEGPNAPGSPMMELRRVGIGGRAGMTYFRLKVHPVSGLFADSLSAGSSATGYGM